MVGFWGGWQGQKKRYLTFKGNFLFFLKKYLFIYLFWPRRVLVEASGIFVAAWGIFFAACGIFSCGVRVGSSSLTRDRTRAPCIGSTESQPLDHQRSPSREIFLIFRDTSLFVVRGVVRTGQSETKDARIIYKNPLFIINTSELRK